METKKQEKNPKEITELNFQIFAEANTQAELDELYAEVSQAIQEILDKGKYHLSHIAFRSNQRSRTGLIKIGDWLEIAFAPLETGGIPEIE